MTDGASKADTRPEAADPRGSRAVDDAEPAIAVDGLTKVYDASAGTVRAVDDVSLEIERGTVVGVLGPNGAGKTTLIKSILGLIIPTEGRVTIEGIDVHEEPAAAYARVGAVLEGARNAYWRLTVRENLEYFASLAGRSPSSARRRHDDLLEWFDLEERADDTVNDLSRGMKQKVSLVSALSRGADVLFLDEPTLGLDVDSSLDLRRELRRMVDAESITVVLSSHDMDVIEELCDRVIIMNDGEVIAEDTVERLTGVFDSQAYEVTVGGQLPARARAEIERDYAVEGFDRTPDGDDRFEVTLPDGTAFYDLMNALEATGRPIVSVDAITPDLESVFLELTDERAGDGRSDPARRRRLVAANDGSRGGGPASPGREGST